MSVHISKKEAEALEQAIGYIEQVMEGIDSDPSSLHDSIELATIKSTLKGLRSMERKALRDQAQRESNQLIKKSLKTARALIQKHKK